MNILLNLNIFKIKLLKLMYDLPHYSIIYAISLEKKKKTKLIKDKSELLNDKFVIIWLAIIILSITCHFAQI